jgi:RNA polymerase sigma-70 factor (ECF subfamily)
MSRTTANIEDAQDHELLGRIAGSTDREAERAWAELKSRVDRPLRQMLQSSFGCTPPEAEDVVEETWARVHRHSHRYRPEIGAVSTWLHSIARNLGKNHLRDAGRDPTAPLSTVEAGISGDGDGQDVQLLARTSDPQVQTPAEYTESRRIRRQLKDAVECLQPSHRAAIKARLRGLSYAEAATELDLKLGTFKPRSCTTLIVA